MKKIILIMMIIVLALTAASCAKEEEVGKYGLTNNTLYVGVDDTYPPMEYVDENGNLVGFDIDFAKALAEELGVNIEFKSTAWDGIFANLSARQYDVIISSVSMTTDRMETMNFSTPYLANGQVIMVSPAMADTIKTPEDLAGLKVGVQFETTADIAATKQKDTIGFELTQYNDMTVCLAAMEAGQIDCIVADMAVAIDAVAKNPEVFKISSAQLTNEPIAVALNKDVPELEAAINDAIAALQASGKLAEISIEHLGDDYTSNIDTVLR
ncbi:MAG: amino acid ABC transporter substrate-binding protein [Clostridia bacterium]|nr:amino acid ABC transporter substrate-binding protein [Clostridia bacterium]